MIADTLSSWLHVAVSKGRGISCMIVMVKGYSFASADANIYFLPLPLCLPLSLSLLLLSAYFASLGFTAMTFVTAAAAAVTVAIQNIC